MKLTVTFIKLSSNFHQTFIKLSFKLLTWKHSKNFKKSELFGGALINSHAWFFDSPIVQTWKYAGFNWKLSGCCVFKLVFDPYVTAYISIRQRSRAWGFQKNRIKCTKLKVNFASVSFKNMHFASFCMQSTVFKL